MTPQQQPKPVPPKGNGGGKRGTKQPRPETNIRQG